MYNSRFKYSEIQPGTCRLFRVRAGRWTHWELAVRQGVAWHLIAAGRSATYQRAIVLREFINEMDIDRLRYFLQSDLFRRCLSIEKT